MTRLAALAAALGLGVVGCGPTLEECRETCGDGHAEWRSFTGKDFADDVGGNLSFCACTPAPPTREPGR